ncbi:MAG: hypothetical protein UV60_C0032G0004 [Parcubacteria group bacterium GW2011_GWA2_43_11]|nr:MAG: hypothetical protein UV60_C0032G0004 [Parcubacteria group bacterium GW2011_GWA2_43_11]
MRLRGIDFGRVHLASGTGGFKCDGTEYWYHGTRFAPDFTGATKNAKTVTLFERTTNNGANMDLDENLRPVERFPRCIAVNPFLCCSDNAAGLANWGIKKHLDSGVWQSWEAPSFVSLIAVGATLKERLREWGQMFAIFAEYLPDFKAPVAIQENHSCPTTGHNPHEYMLSTEPEQVLDIGADLGVPQIPKFNVMQLSLDAGLRIGAHKECDALLLSNTVPWMDLPLWMRLLSFGTPFSPLRWRGIKQDGGYSGPLLLPLVEEKIRTLRIWGFTKPIIACGGITKAKHVDRMCDAGADAIEFATVAMLRPWRVQEIIDRAITIPWPRR